MLHRAHDFLRPIALIAFCLVALWGMEATRVQGSTRVQHVDDVPEDTRLVVFWIDSLAARDMRRGGPVPRLHRRLDSALHGPVRSCADAVSVPCFTAMTTGVDRFSMFSLARNFAGSDGVPSNSLFHELQRRGRRIGYLGDPIFTNSVFGFDWKVIEHEMDDLDYIRRGLHALDAQRLDVVVIHIREPDKLSHSYGPRSTEYRQALHRVDEAIDRAFGDLRPSDHVVVLGDHGHDEEGRHFAGLDVPTYAAYWGPAFQRPFEKSMAITDHAALWGRVFGLRFSDVPWVESYFAGRGIDDPQSLPSVPGGPPLPWSSALILLVIALPISIPSHTWRRWSGLRFSTWTAAAVVAAFTALGFFWTDARPLLNWRPKWVDLSIAAGMGLAAYPLVKAWVDRMASRAPQPRDALGVWLAGVVLLAMPTVYKYGGAAAAIAGLCVVGAEMALRAHRRRDWKSAVRLAVAVGALLTVVDPAVRNFAVRWFPVYSELFAGWVVALVLPAVALVGWMGRGDRDRTWWLAASVLGVALAAGVGTLPDRVYILPCAAAVPALVLAHRVPRLGSLAWLSSIPALAFFFGGDMSTLGPMAAVLVAWVLWFGSSRTGSPVRTGVALLVLLWASLWVTIGCRGAGLDFQYFFHWLDPGVDVKDTWVLNATLTLFKYLTLPLLGLLIARRVYGGSYRDALATAWSFGRARTGLVLLFVVAFSVRSSAAGPFVTIDVLQELLVWVVILLAIVLGGYSRDREQAVEGRGLPAHGSGHPHELA